METKQQEMRNPLAGVVWVVMSALVTLFVRALLIEWGVSVDDYILGLLSAAVCGVVTYRIALNEPRLTTKDDAFFVGWILLESAWLTIILSAAVLIRVGILTLINMCVLFISMSAVGLLLFYLEREEPFEPAVLGGMRKLRKQYGSHIGEKGGND